MVVGEGQILGQTREALRVGQEHGTVGPALNTLFQQALRVGKRAHAETDIDRAAPSLVSAALERSIGPGRRCLASLVIGAGAMASLAVAHRLARRRVQRITVSTAPPPTPTGSPQEYGARSAAAVGARRRAGRRPTSSSPAPARPSSWSASPTCSQPPARASTARWRSSTSRCPTTSTRPSPTCPASSLISLAALADELRDPEAAAGVDDVRAIVAQEIAAFLSARRQASVTPTVVALRSMATSVVDAEMERLAARLPDLDDATRAEVLQTVRRVADKLLHEPTVRVKELADAEPAVSYAAALAELFRLDPEAVDAVTRPASREGKP